ncbi:MAG TPA: hypothetical protein VKS79_21200 [Gemmataceae bacterium]|nr:hypothetical protein [Gemmataceae bacterium]
MAIQGERRRLQALDQATHKDVVESQGGEFEIKQWHRHKHLFMDEGCFGQAADGSWHAWPPGGFCIRIKPPRKVEEHDDGAVTISGPPFKTRDGEMLLVKGHWKFVGEPEDIPNPEPPAPEARGPIPS